MKRNSRETKLLTATVAIVAVMLLCSAWLKQSQVTGVGRYQFIGTFIGEREVQVSSDLPDIELKANGHWTMMRDTYTQTRRYTIIGRNITLYDFFKNQSVTGIFTEDGFTLKSGSGGSHMRFAIVQYEQPRTKD